MNKIKNSLETNYQKSLQQLKKQVENTLNPLKTQNFYHQFQQICLKFHQIILSILNQFTSYFSDSFYLSLDSIIHGLQNALQGHKRQVFRQTFFEKDVKQDQEQIYTCQIDEIQQFINCRNDLKPSTYANRQQLDYFLEKRQAKQQWIKQLLKLNFQKTDPEKTKKVLQKLQRISVGIGQPTIQLNNSTQTENLIPISVLPSNLKDKKTSILSCCQGSSISTTTTDISDMKFPQFDSIVSLPKILQKNCQDRISLKTSQPNEILFNLDAISSKITMKVVMEDQNCQSEVSSRKNIIKQLINQKQKFTKTANNIGFVRLKQGSKKIQTNKVEIYKNSFLIKEKQRNSFGVDDKKQIIQKRSLLTNHKLRQSNNYLKDKLSAYI